MDQLVALCKRRGFIFASQQAYGGLQGLYDWGPMGVEIRNHLKNAWWSHMVYQRNDVEGLDSAILTNRKVLQHSGHEDTFTDPLVDCRACKSRMRADFITNGQCLFCQSTDLTEPRDFNLMFSTTVGPVANEENLAYLRPETAQGIFLNFKNVIDSHSKKIPFGIAQIGKAFRNEITPRNFIFRVREFEQMELEFFVDPSEDEKWHDYWIDARYQWWLEQGLSADKLTQCEQPPEDLSHYSKRTVDLLYRYPHGDEELEGIANRTDYDLGSHTKSADTLNIQAKVKPNNESVVRLAYQDLSTNKWVVPFVIEPSCGVDRGVLALLTEAYHEETLENGGTRTVLKLKPHLAPVKFAIIPIAKNKDEIMQKALKLTDEMKRVCQAKVVFEATGNIGKAYRRHDETGTPFCITVDFETIGQGESHLIDTVTVRHRDTMEQTRMSIAELIAKAPEMLRRETQEIVL